MERPAYLLEFEKPLRELEKQLESLHQQSLENNIDMAGELATIEAKIDTTKREIYSSLPPWQRGQVARHSRRPYALDYVGTLCVDFQELHGARQFKDDQALIGGAAFFEGRPVMIIPHQNGPATQANIS